MSPCDCPTCGGPAVCWADRSDGITVNFACDNARCKAGKGPWDTPRPERPTVAGFLDGLLAGGSTNMVDDRTTVADRNHNRTHRDGIDRCYCGCKYWSYDRCVDCGGDEVVDDDD